MKLNKRFVFLILACVFILISLYFITQIYGKYLSSASGNAEIPISRWNIKVNNQTIKTNSDISAIVSPVFPGNAYISANIIAPAAEGYFDLDFDMSAVDVSFKYDITTSIATGSAVSDLVTTGYSIDNGIKINFSNYNDPITKTILLSDHITTQKIRIYVMWNDSADTATMNNLADTSSTLSTDNVAKFTVHIAFTQITG